jgi:hypothetical protein
MWLARCLLPLNKVFHCRPNSEAYSSLGHGIYLGWLTARPPRVCPGTRDRGVLQYIALYCILSGNDGAKISRFYKSNLVLGYFKN